MKENLSQKPEETHENLPLEYIDKENFMCDKCPKVFNSENQIQKHMTLFHMKEESIETKDCKTCVKKFRSPSIYINHYQEEHGSVPPEYSDKTLFFCEKCPKAYLSKTQLTEHIQKSHYSKEIKKSNETNASGCEVNVIEK